MKLMITALEQIIRSKGDKDVLSTDYVLNWLHDNWELYLYLVDNNACTHRSNTFPCFCNARKKDCLFVAIYTKLSVLDNYESYNKKSALLLTEYDKIKDNPIEIKNWLKRNTDFALNSLSSFDNYTCNRVLRRSFINGKNKVSGDFDYLFIYVSLGKFVENYELKRVYDKLFFEEVLLPKELEDYNRRLEEGIASIE